MKKRPIQITIEQPTDYDLAKLFGKASIGVKTCACSFAGWYCESIGRVAGLFTENEINILIRKMATLDPLVNPSGAGHMLSSTIVNWIIDDYDLAGKIRAMTSFDRFCLELWLKSQVDDDAKH